MKLSTAITALFVLGFGFLSACVSKEVASKPRRPTTMAKSPASIANTTKIVRSLKGKELNCETTDGIKTHLSKIREANGKFYAQVDAWASSPAEMQISNANRSPQDPKGVQLWLPYGSGSMGAEAFVVNCGMP